MVAFESLYREQTRMFEALPIAATPTSSNRLEPVPLSFSVGLGELPPSQYICQGKELVSPTEKHFLAKLK
jgi:hypothetical protein